MNLRQTVRQLSERAQEIHQQVVFLGMEADMSYENKPMEIVSAHRQLMKDFNRLCHAVNKIRLAVMLMDAAVNVTYEKTNARR